MANTNFDVSEFLSNTYYAPITVGQHKVTLGLPKTTIQKKPDGSDASYLSVKMSFPNGRVVEPRFYGLGAKIFCDQLRTQCNDATDYKKPAEFLKTLKDKEVDLWVSKRTYADSDGKEKTTLQYDFVAPKVATDDDEDGPF